MIEARGRAPFVVAVAVAVAITPVGCGGQAAPSSLRAGSPSATIEATASGSATAAQSSAPDRSGTSAAVADRMIDIGTGERLHLRCTAGTGRTVILDADLNGDVSEFEFVMPRLPLTMRACAYDRAGEGSSSRAPKSGRTSADMANELHALLAGAKLSGPYVLVGNHFGGLFDLRFAAMYPDDVGGLVLLDPFLPTAFVRFHADCAGISGPDPNNEAIDMCAMMRDAGRASLTPPDVPLVVVTAADNPGWPSDEFQVWLKSQSDLAASVTNGRELTVHSELVIPREQPDATVQAIKDVVAAERP